MDHLIRNVIRNYWEGIKDTCKRTPFENLQEKYDILADQHEQKLKELYNLYDEVHELVCVILDNDLRLPNEDLEY